MDKLPTWLLVFISDYGGKILDNLEPILSIAYALLMMAVFTWLATSYRKRLKNKDEPLRRLLKTFPGKVSVWFCEPILKSDYGGLPFSVELLAAGKSAPRVLAITADTPLLFRLAIYKDSPLFWMHKRFGIYKDLDICKSDFNKEFLVTSDNEVLAHNYLNNPRRNQTIRDFFSAGFSSLTISGGKVSVQLNNYNEATDLEPGIMTKRVIMLTTLAQGM